MKLTAHKKAKWKDTFTAGLQDFFNRRRDKTKNSQSLRSFPWHATGKLVFQIIRAVAEFEKDIIRERVRAGLENARQKGKRLGRPEIDNDVLQTAIVLR